MYLALISLWNAAVDAASSGRVAVCDPYSSLGWGCSAWANPAVRTKECLDQAPHGLMDWVLAPTRTSEYLLTAEKASGGARTSYAPGEKVDLVLNVRRRDYKFRGVLITAYDARNNTVGRWSIASGNDALFWCARSCACVHART